MMLPFIVAYLLEYKYQQRYMFPYRLKFFNYFYEFLFDGLKTDVHGYLQYYSVYLFRKFAFAHICYFLGE